MSAKITLKNVLDQDAYRNTLDMLEQTNGLTYKQLLYALLGDKAVKTEENPNGYLKDKEEIKEIISILREKKSYKYKISGEVPKTSSRLSECLTRLKNMRLVKMPNAENKELQKLGVIKKFEDKEYGNRTFYEVTDLFIALKTAKNNKEKIDEFYEQLTSLSKTTEHIFSIKDLISVHIRKDTDLEKGNKEIYKKKKKLDEILERFQRDVGNLINDLNELSKSSRDLWREKDYCSWLDMKESKPLMTIVIQIPPMNINNKEIYIDTAENTE